MANKTDEYRAKAEHCRQMADQVVSPMDKEMWLQLAADWLSMACGLQFRAKLNLMEYRGIRYTIRVGIERGQWFVAIHPDDIEMKGKVVIFGKREDAELDAHRMIDRWLDPKSRRRINRKR